MWLSLSSEQTVNKQRNVFEAYCVISKIMQLIRSNFLRLTRTDAQHTIWH